MVDIKKCLEGKVIDEVIVESEKRFGIESITCITLVVNGQPYDIYGYALDDDGNEVGCVYLDVDEIDVTPVDLCYPH